MFVGAQGVVVEIEEGDGRVAAGRGSTDVIEKRIPRRARINLLKP